MLAVTVLGTNGWLIPYGPNTDGDPVHVSASVQVDSKRGLTGRTTRRPQALLLRYQASWISAMYPADFNAARIATMAAQDEPIFIPFWPAAQPVGAAPRFTAGAAVYWTANWAAWAVNPASTVGYTYYAPLLQGRLTQAPRQTGKTSTIVLAEWTFKEDGPSSMALQPAAVADTTFVTPAGVFAAIFPWVPEGTEPPKPSFASVNVERQAIGPGRQQTTVFYPQNPEQGSQILCKFTSAAAAFQLLSWWQRRGGGADSFWLASSQKLGDLSADLAAGGESLTFTQPFTAATPAALLGLGTAVAVFGPDAPMEMLRVNAITGAGYTLNTSTPLANNHLAAWTIVTPALLVTHADQELAMEFRRAGSDWLATATLSFREVAAEYAPPADETIGSTIGRMPGVAWFFQIDMDYNGAISSTYLTNWESGIVADGIAWTYNDCSFDKLVASIDLEDDGTTFSMQWYDGSPIANWLPGALAARGFLTIYRADVSAAGVISHFGQIWKGEMSTPTLDGPLVKQKVLGANAIFSRRAPRQLMSPSCGTNLFKPRCGVSQANYTATAVVVSVAGNVLTLGTFGGPGAAQTGFGGVNWFALGWVGWTTAGLPFRGGCLTSTALAGGQIQLTLDTPIPLAAGAAVTAVPGCDRTRATCIAKFNNLARNRGFPDMPAVDPGFIIPQTSNNPAKK